MRPIFQTRSVVLFLGDIVVFSVAVWISLVVRVFELPEAEVVRRFVVAFGFLFALWILVFLGAGLYEKRVLVYRRVQAPRLAVALGVNAVVAALVFFLVPEFGIAPKTILAINLVVSLLLSFLWRLWVFPYLFGVPIQDALIVGESTEITELRDAMESSGLFRTEQLGSRFLSRPGAVGVPEEIRRRLSGRSLDLIVMDVGNPILTDALADLYAPLASGVSVVGAAEAYEDVFGRISLAHISDSWVIHNLTHHQVYDVIKRVIDLVASGAGLLILAVLFPFIAIAIRLDSRGSVLIVQDRVGQFDRPIRLYKFRSMQRNDTSLSGGKEPNAVTRIGHILRKSRLDELPQLINVLKGDLSLIGPRPELPAGVAIYERELPYFKIRHLIKPGLSGWAQLYHDNHPHHSVDIEATREKLSYDLYYLKHRSLTLDGVIAIKTIRKVLAQSGT